MRALETINRQTKVHSWDDSTFDIGDIMVSGVYMHCVGKTSIKYHWAVDRSSTIVYSQLCVGN